MSTHSRSHTSEPTSVAAITGAAWLYYTEGNMLLLGMVYMLYRRTQTPAPGAVGTGAAPPQ